MRQSSSECNPVAGSVSTTCGGDLEEQILKGTRLLTAAEVAERMGYRGKRGTEKVREMMTAGVIPAWRPGRAGEWRAHWPTILQSINK